MVAASWENLVAGLVGRADGCFEACQVKTLSWGRGQGEGERQNSKLKTQN